VASGAGPASRMEMTTTPGMSGPKGMVLTMWKVYTSVGGRNLWSARKREPSAAQMRLRRERICPGRDDEWEWGAAAWARSGWSG
jgi:hypothetical protein